ncbi:MAG: tRNA (guanosine(46)-N7)-methyltransferase TrmB [Chromatiales bacterium]|jgi:tRNA (guanine-N7-)-methyltransferase|nr:tRNA (guanosine(46)-N7)-methyltransferase TrmB [Chromatiales bacterium]MDX9765970.1 tRNA (guanosine(46)-N7)-methyltransferase TrmB [Ectothiorhodospiraceae bacterium]
MPADPRDTEHPPRRPVRSFVLREGRMTSAQREAIERLWPRYGIDLADAPLDLRAPFGNDNPVTLEIGFGNGDTLATLAARHPERNFLGIEVHRPGVGHLLKRLEAEGLGNVRLLRDDAVEVLRRMIADAALDRVLLYFPDPWPKTRHHKRRIVQPAFVELVARKLAPGGVFHLATDWEDYAQHMLAVMEDCPTFENLAGPGAFSPRPDDRPLTRFERRGQRLGHGVWDLLYRRR